MHIMNYLDNVQKLNKIKLKKKHIINDIINSITNIN